MSNPPLSDSAVIGPSRTVTLPLAQPLLSSEAPAPISAGPQSTDASAPISVPVFSSPPLSTPTLTPTPIPTSPHTEAPSPVIQVWTPSPPTAYALTPTQNSPEGSWLLTGLFPT